MSKRKFTIEVTAVVEVELDESLVPDDEWRATFYDIWDLEDVATHIAYNAAANGVERISRLDGFADRDDSLASIRIVEWLEPEVV